jgi:hypothetical protein
MRGLRLLVLILLAALFVVGGPLRTGLAQAGSAAPACHEMAGETPDPPPGHKRLPEAMVANCCVGCLPAAARDLAPVLVPARRQGGVRRPSAPPGRAEPRAGTRASPTLRLKPFRAAAARSPLIPASERSVS